MQTAPNPDKSYLECIKRFPLKPIRTDQENDLAADVCDALLDRFESLSIQERDYFEVLSRLVSDYESKWQEEENVTPRQLLIFLMEQNGLAQTDLIKEFGSSSRASEYLSSTRPDLSLGQAVRLADRFSLSPAAFINKEKFLRP